MEAFSFSSAASAMDRILAVAAEEGASDIHIEPGPDAVVIRFRKDGLLHHAFSLPVSMAASLAVRCKVMGRMDVAETRIPQDGSCPFGTSREDMDLRLSTLPSIWGETVVIRLLTSSLPFIEDNALGMLPEQESLFLRCLHRQSGLILTAGPTGSGKTSTLYAALRLLHRPEISIISVEDPVEYRIPGITQVLVNERAGLTFASGLRSLVRQDPDVIMIGEIRDRETAEIAVHAALTGHLVLSTIHTDSSAKTPLRLMDMGIPPYLLAASLSLIVSQRLAAIQCTACSGKGCSHCHNTGRAGRTGIFELLEINEEVRTLLHDKAAPSLLDECRQKQHQPSMKDAALLRWREGVITKEETSLF